MVVTKLNMRRPIQRGRSIALRLVGLLFVVLLICSALSIFVGWKATHKPRAAINDTPANYGMKFDSIEFSSRQGGLKLKGWYLPASGQEKGITLIFAHGYGKNRLQSDVNTLALSKPLIENGYNIVLFDFRGSGESEGSMTSIGYFEKYDLLGAIDWVKANHSGKIGLVGFSMGATTALEAAADEPDVIGVVADSPFSQLGSYLRDNLPVWSHLPAFPFTPLILELMPTILGIDPNGVDALDAVDRIDPRPILFIHSVDDKKVPYTNSESMYKKHPDHFEFWKTTKANHVGSYKQQPQEYVDKLLSFLAKW